MRATMTHSFKQYYQDLVKLSTRASLYSGINMLLDWDLETYMPKKAIEVRSQQSELIASLIHTERTSKAYEKTLSSLIDLETGTVIAGDLTSRQKAALREWRRDYLNEVKLPTSFVEKWAKVTSEATHAWSAAREANDFKAFQPHLEKVVDLVRKKADYYGYDEHPYDALLGYFEPGMTTKVVTSLLERLKLPLIDLLKKIQAKPQPEASFLDKTYDHAKQLAFGKKILEKMGFDPTFSRLDESAHPMCIPAHPYDMRMTTRVYPNEVYVNVLSCVHEGGHGLYHSNLPVEDFGTPLGEATSLGIDESQSRTWETIIGRSLPFWKYWYPLLQKTFPENLGDVHLETFYHILNRVRPSFIRVDSDEVTYNLHIMLRFEMEKALLEGEIEAKDIPEAWNEKMLSYFGITPPAPALGCLQDIHWSLGAIGYFPTYTLGNLYAAQFFETFATKHPNWEEWVETGKLTMIADWQQREIHRFGREYLAEDLCEKVTGKPLSEKPFLNYLENKYTPLYHLS